MSTSSPPIPARRRGRIRRIALAICLLTVVGMAGVGGDADPASALCAGSTPNYISGTWGYVTWGNEQSNGITCDGDNVYRGWVQDPYTDGSCVAMAFADTTYPRVYMDQGVSCDAAGYIYTFYGQPVTYLGVIYKYGQWNGDVNVCPMARQICYFDLHYGF